MNQSVAARTQVHINFVIELTIGEGPPEGETPRLSFIEFEVSETISGTFDFELLRNGDVLRTIPRNVSLNRTIRFDFEDTGVQHYAVNVRNRANNREGVFVAFTIDFMGDEAVRVVSQPENPNIFLAITEPSQTTAVTTTPTEPTTAPTSPTEDVTD
jgi:hypothetical protein